MSSVVHLEAAIALEEPLETGAIGIRPGFPERPADVAPIPWGPHRARGKPKPVLPADPAIFGWLERRWAPGEMTVWMGPFSAVEPVLELLYAGNALARGRISLIEGANRFHPYRIGEQGRALGADPADVLSRIRLARAFTAHQLVSLVDGWAAEARRHRPCLLIAHELPQLFEAEEVAPEEREALLRHVAGTLGAMMHGLSVPLLLVLDGGFSRFPGLLREGPRIADLVAFARRPLGLALRAYRDDDRAELVHRPGGQRGMEEFFADPRQEVFGWDAPRRRTARHWKNG